ncbi:hypothetical protein V5O48_002164 [Marasmius crinis-equi]|uniref:Triplex capsid protein 1 n=1 Tax=Marasmius crinis-equi TaxID=585013 RepID=A0ABR3FWF9_9AGAR
MDSSRHPFVHTFIASMNIEVLQDPHLQAAPFIISLLPGDPAPTIAIQPSVATQEDVLSTQPSVTIQEDVLSTQPTIVLVDDAISVVVEHMLDMYGPRDNVSRALTLKRAVTRNVLPRFYRQIYIMTPDALNTLIATLNAHSYLETHVDTLHIGMSMFSPFTLFRPLLERLLEYESPVPLPAEQWALVPPLVNRVVNTVRSLAIVACAVTQTFANSILGHSFLGVTELAAPIQFIFTPSSPFVLGVAYDPNSGIGDYTWPNLRTLSTWIVESTDFLDDIDRRVDFRHLQALERLSILFRYIDCECAATYMRGLKVGQSVECVSLELAHPPPTFPLYTVVTDTFFFDPRVVFIHKGPVTHALNRAVELYARDQAPAFYDLILFTEPERAPCWEQVYQKVGQRRDFALQHGYLYPEDRSNVVQVDAGPFAVSDLLPPEAGEIDWRFGGPPSLESFP